MMLSAEQKKALYVCYNAMADKKAEGILVLDLRKITSVADFFIICEGSNPRQAQAISDNVEKVLREKTGQKKYHIEGKEKGAWILMDFQDLVLHIFNEPVRGFYALEKLWSDARKLDTNEIITWG